MHRGDINPSAFKCHSIPQLQWHHIQSTFIQSIKFILLDDIQQCKFISSGWMTFIHQISGHHINSFTFSKKMFLGRPVNTNPFADSDVQKQYMINSALGTFHDSCKDNPTNAMALACTDGTLNFTCVWSLRSNVSKVQSAS
jgi:hypothetical protein